MNLTIAPVPYIANVTEHYVHGIALHQAFNSEDHVSMQVFVAGPILIEFLLV